MASEMSLLPAALRIARYRGMSIPPELTRFGMRVCRTDFTSSHDFRWPFPGGWADSAAPDPANTRECPAAPGDGLCVGLTWRGMTSGGLSAAGVVLLVGWRDEDCLTVSPRDKVRVRRAYVVDAVTIADLLADRTDDEPFDLRGADLQRADLQDANLQGANLWGADLQRANLWGADLQRADLQRAYLWGADLQDANLQDANLQDAYLWGADLQDANLQDANLQDAYLQDADLQRANLQRANLRGANLQRANLQDANLQDANLQDAIGREGNG